ncbi:MAG: hypothetical protein ACK6DZ_14780, partial [Acidobacteriota bacterium]
MQKLSWTCRGIALLATGLCAADKPTFYRDVQPSREKRCVGCHRPGVNWRMSESMGQRNSTGLS